MHFGSTLMSNPHHRICRDRLHGSGGSAGRLGPPLEDDDAFSYRYTSLDEVQGQVLSIARDQNGCR